MKLRMPSMKCMELEEPCMSFYNRHAKLCCALHAFEWFSFACEDKLIIFGTVHLCLALSVIARLTIKIFQTVSQKVQIAEKIG